MGLEIYIPLLVAGDHIVTWTYVTEADLNDGCRVSSRRLLALQPHLPKEQTSELDIGENPRQVHLNKQVLTIC
jgi:hypothetical protein